MKRQQVKTVRLELVIKRGSDNCFWGRVNYNNILYTYSAGSIDEVEARLKKILGDFDELNGYIIEFERTYDIFSLFKDFDFINISRFAKYIGLNAGLLRQYASGVKHPSERQLQKILRGFHSITSQMGKVELLMG
jgi:hypothetical protein